MPEQADVVLCSSRRAHIAIRAVLPILRVQEEAAPRPEDMECLCKLMTTVGAQLDSTSKDENRRVRHRGTT